MIIRHIGMILTIICSKKCIFYLDKSILQYLIRLVYTQTDQNSVNTAHSVFVYSSFGMLRHHYTASYSVAIWTKNNGNNNHNTVNTNITYLKVLESHNTTDSKSSLRFLTTFFTQLVKFESNALTLSSSLIKSVCLMHINMIYAGRPGNNVTAVRGFKSKNKQE